MNKAIRSLAFVCAILFSLSAFASAVIEDSKGEVKDGASANAATAVTKGQRLAAGSTVVTGPKSITTLRFDDGQAVVLNENSEFKVTEYSFSKEDAKKDKFVFELVRGAMRSVTGLLTRRNPQAYALRTPQATIGIRGTDFMVALVNPAFLSVLNGAIDVGNKAGSANFAAGSTATVPSATALPTAIPASSLPASVASSFSQLSSVTITAGAGAAAEAGGAAVGGLTPAAVGIAGAIAAGIAAAAGGDDTTPATPGTTGTTGTTGTQ
jgi:hypothetical protein